jgi:membrane-bound lytic murein transglycosylase D
MPRPNFVFMRVLLLIIFSIIFCNCYAVLPRLVQDTSGVDTTKEKQVIEQVVKESSPPPAERAKTINEVTKYGFKNLFKQFAYNPAAPYSEQINPHAEIYMQDYLQAHGLRLKAMKKTALPYFNFIDRILSMYGLPRELKYLAVIESDLKASALSWVGARGPWQFMPSTARGYGLKVNNQVDERTDYEKSTHAAAKHLLNLYKDLKDWLLVIAAYNGGTGRVHSAIKKSGSRDFWKLQYYLPTESKNHVKKFIATHYIMETNTEDGFNYTKLQPADKVDSTTLNEDQKKAESLTISGKYKAAIIAKAIGMTMEDFERLNPNLDKVLSLGISFDLRLPTDKMTLFVANKYAILEQSVQSILKEVNK